MTFLTLAYIKAHSRIDYDIEDTLLEMYADSAEQMIFNMCGRSYEDFIENYGEIPTPVIHAGLMLVDAAYQQRSPISSTTMSVVPYTFDFLIKPYMRLVTGC